MNKKIKTERNIKIIDSSINMSNFKVVVIDGVIAAGKTTYINTLYESLTKRGYNVYIVKEPEDVWRETGILQTFYSDLKRWSFMFQTAVFHDRINENIKVFNQHNSNISPNTKPTVFICERSPFTDTIFMKMLHQDGLVTELEMLYYGKLWTMWNRLMPYIPDLFIYLKPSLEICIQRYKERARPGEIIDMTYESNLEKEHDLFFKDQYISTTDKTDNLIKIPVKTIINNDNFKTDSKIKESVTDQFISFLNEI